MTEILCWPHHGVGTILVWQHLPREATSMRRTMTVSKEFRMFVHDSLRDNAQSTVPLRVQYEYTDLETCKHITTNTG